MNYIYLINSPWEDYIQVDEEYYHKLYSKNIFKEVIFNEYITFLIYPITYEIIAYKIKKG